MKNIFKSKKEFDEFNEKGFVVISFLNPKQIVQLTELYKEVQPVSFPGFSSTIYNKDIELKRKTSDKIFNIVSVNVDDKFQNFRTLGAGFLCKTPGIESEMQIHQDWTIVEEKTNFSATIWAPLQDVDYTNGSLMVIPCSHQLTSEVRGPSLPPLVDSVLKDLESQLINIPLKAGEAIVFNHAIIHASPPNLSNIERLAVTVGLLHIDSKLTFCHFSNGKLQKFNIQDDFFLTYNSIGDAPEQGNCIEEVDYNPKLITRKEVVQFINKRDKRKTKNMKTLFADPEKQDFFEKNGYVKFQMLDKIAVDELFDYYHQQGLRDHSGYGFNMSMEDDDKEKVKQIRKKIFDTALPQAMPHFSNAKVIAGSFVVKEKNPLGVVPPHQDWTFVENEEEYNSVTCWISLVPTKMENGYMGVIKGSHLFYDNHRPSPSPQVPTPLMNHLFAIFPYLEMFEMQPGEALIFDQRTFHASTPNITDEPRIAIGIGFTQEDAKLCHYSLKPNDLKDTLIKYAVDDSFLSIYDNSTISKLYDDKKEISGFEVMEEIPFYCPAESTELLVERILAAGNTYNHPLAEHMGNLFGGMMNNNESHQNNGMFETEKQNFWKIYTPLNIIREIRFRLTKK
jgi:ectoine hydroxylase-related dioxygenase (phytanoyl-CoA dioxygenase family)